MTNLDASTSKPTTASEAGVLVGEFVDGSHVKVRDFDGGEHTFGPVVLTPGSEHPRAGDKAYGQETGDGELVIAAWGRGLANASVIGERLSLRDPRVGALGDGTTDDTAAIGRVPGLMPAAGGVLEAPPGLYPTDEPLQVSNFMAVRGDGQSSILRCTGDNFAFAFDPGNRASVCGMQIDAQAPQAAGGAFDFTSAAFNIRIDDIYLANNLHTSFDIRPGASAGHYQISRVKWNGVAGCTNGILLGDGTHLVADVSFREILGVAATSTGMGTWLTAKNNVDTPHMDDVVFYRGAAGIVLGEDAAGTCSNAKLHQVVVDTMTGMGINLSKAQDIDLTACAVQTCGDASHPGLNIGVHCTLARVSGGIVQNNGGNGVEIQNGSLYTTIVGMIAADNNTSNTAFRDGISVAANTQRFKIIAVTSGNGIRNGNGHQKQPVRVADGTSDYYVIRSVDGIGNETADTIYDGGTGTHKDVAGNL